MSDLLVGIVVTAGTAFVLFSALGVLRLPDLYTRLSAATKAATLGVGMILVSVALYFNDWSITTRTVAIILFVTLTSPVGAHMLGRSSYFLGVKLWKGSVINDLKGKYDRKTYELSSEEEDKDKT